MRSISHELKFYDYISMIHVDGFKSIDLFNGELITFLLSLFAFFTTIALESFLFRLV